MVKQTKRVFSCIKETVAGKALYFLRTHSAQIL